MCGMWDDVASLDFTVYEEPLHSIIFYGGTDEGFDGDDTPPS